MDDWRNQCHSALPYQQEHFENAAQEHQMVAYEQVEIAAALATSRTAVQMTSRSSPGVRATPFASYTLVISQRASHCTEQPQKWGAKTAHVAGPFEERSWVEPGTSEADTPSTVATRRPLSADYRRWRGRHCEIFRFTRSVTDA